MRQLPLPELCRKVWFAFKKTTQHLNSWVTGSRGLGRHAVHGCMNTPLGLAVCTARPPLLGLRLKHDSYLEEGQGETFDTELTTVGTTEAT